MLILGTDYVQAEAVVVAYLSLDKKQQNAFKTKQDVHKFMASLMFDIPPDKVNKDQRKIGKTLRHAINYDGKVSAVARTLDVNRKRAKELLDIAHRAVPNLQGVYYPYVQKTLMENNMTLRNVWGGRIKCHAKWDQNLMNFAYSWEPQSTVGIMLCKAFVDFYNNYGSEFNILTQEHDGMSIACQESEADVLRGIDALARSMYRPAVIRDQKMVIDADFKIGSNWGNMKEIKRESEDSENLIVCVGTDDNENSIWEPYSRKAVG